jgi:hypothetical protein
MANLSAFNAAPHDGAEHGAAARHAAIDIAFEAERAVAL